MISLSRKSKIIRFFWKYSCNYFFVNFQFLFESDMQKFWKHFYIVKEKGEREKERKPIKYKKTQKRYFLVDFFFVQKILCVVVVVFFCIFLYLTIFFSSYLCIVIRKDACSLRFSFRWNFCGVVFGGGGVLNKVRNWPELTDRPTKKSAFSVKGEEGWTFV